MSVTEGSRNWVTRLAESEGWRLYESVTMDGLMASWTVDAWVKGTPMTDASVVELSWCDLGRGPVFKHGLYRSPRLDKRGQLKALRGEGHPHLYWSVEKALKEA